MRYEVKTLQLKQKYVSIIIAYELYIISIK
jgi:hypothetical protein